VPGETDLPESTRPGLRASRSTCASAVSQEVLAPFRVARSLSLNRVDTAGRARGLCGAPDGARGRRAASLALHRLDPDGWLVQSSTDTNPIQSPAAQRRAGSATFNPPSPRPGSRGPRLGKPCPLDTRLLMGGTFLWHLLYCVRVPALLCSMKWSAAFHQGSSRAVAVQPVQIAGRGARGEQIGRPALRGTLDTVEEQCSIPGLVEVGEERACACREARPRTVCPARRGPVCIQICC